MAVKNLLIPKLLRRKQVVSIHFHSSIILATSIVVRFIFLLACKIQHNIHVYMHVVFINIAPAKKKQKKKKKKKKKKTTHLSF